MLTVEKNANAMYSYCKENDLGSGVNAKWGIKHFTIIENELKPDENLEAIFIGLHNYESISKHDGNFAYAVTDQRILFAQKKMIGEERHAVSLKNINDISLDIGTLLGTIKIDARGESFSIAVRVAHAENIYSLINDVLLYAKTVDRIQNSPKAAAPEKSPVEQLKDLKELLDMGILTQEEFDDKKADILDMM